MTDKTGRTNCSAETDETAVLEAENDRYRDRRLATSPQPDPQHTAAHTRSAQYTGRISRSALARFQISFITRVLNKIYKFRVFSSPSVRR